MDILSEPDWRPPKISSELLIKIKPFIHDYEYFMATEHKCQHFVSTVDEKYECHNEITWWCPQSGDCFCEEHVTSGLTNFLKQQWRWIRYQYFIKEIFPKLKK